MKILDSPGGEDLGAQQVFAPCESESAALEGDGEAPRPAALARVLRAA